MGSYIEDENKNNKKELLPLSSAIIRIVKEIKKNNITPEKVSDILSKIGYKGTRKLLRLGSGAQGHADLMHDEGLKVWKWFTGTYGLQIPHMKTQDEMWKILNKELPDHFAKYFGIHSKYPNTIKLEYLPFKIPDLKEMEKTLWPMKFKDDALNLTKSINKFNNSVGILKGIRIVDVNPFSGHNVAYDLNALLDKIAKLKVYDLMNWGPIYGNPKKIEDEIKRLKDQLGPLRLIEGNKNIQLNNKDLLALDDFAQKVKNKGAISVNNINEINSIIKKSGTITQKQYNSKELEFINKVIKKGVNNKNPINVKTTGILRRIPKLGIITSFLLPSESIAPGNRYQYSPLTGEKMDMSKDWQKYKEHEKAVEEINKITWEPILKSLFK